jgi:hypothetical protein
MSTPILIIHSILLFIGVLGNLRSGVLHKLHDLNRPLYEFGKFHRAEMFSRASACLD